MQRQPLSSTRRRAAVFLGFGCLLVSYRSLAAKYVLIARAAVLEPGGALFTYSYIISAPQCAKGGAYDVSAREPKFLQISIFTVCVHLAGAASLADSADFESKGCVRSILDV